MAARGSSGSRGRLPYQRPPRSPRIEECRTFSQASLRLKDYEISIRRRLLFPGEIVLDFRNSEARHLLAPAGLSLIEVAGRLLNRSSLLCGHGCLRSRRAFPPFPLPPAQSTWHLHSHEAHSHQTPFIQLASIHHRPPSNIFLWALSAPLSCHLLPRERKRPLTFQQRRRGKDRR